MKENYQQNKQTEMTGENNVSFRPMPEIITSPYPFLAVGDLTEIVGRLVPGLETSPAVETIQERLLGLQQRYAPKESSFYYMEQGELVQRTDELIYQRINEEWSEGKNTGVINFDRYLLTKVDSENIIRLNLSRSPDGTLTARPGTSIDKTAQIAQMRKWLKQGDYDSIILADDVVAFADTFGQVVGLIREISPQATISVACGICSSQGIWSGKEKLARLGVEVSSVVTSTASAAIEGGSSGMAIPDSRDFTFFGGKVRQTEDGRTLTFPYFYPFSKPLASFYETGEEMEASRQLLGLNLDLVAVIEERIGRQLSIGDLEAAGFGIPYSSILEVQAQLAIPESSVRVSDYLSQAGRI